MADTPNIYQEWGYNLALVMVAFTTCANTLVLRQEYEKRRDAFDRWLFIV